MSRDLDPNTLEAISQEVVQPFFAVELLFDGSQTLRMWTGQGTLVLDNGTQWVGTGNLLDVSSIEETSEMSVKGATLTLSGVPSEVLSLALSEPYQGRVCNIYFGVFTAGGSLLKETSDYILLQDGSRINVETGEKGFNQLFSGYMDQMNIDDGPETSTIELKVENRLIDLERARVARYTQYYQKSIYPNDNGLDFVEDLQTRKVPWGRSEDA